MVNLGQYVDVIVPVFNHEVLHCPHKAQYTIDNRRIFFSELPNSIR